MCFQCVFIHMLRSIDEYLQIITKAPPKRMPIDCRRPLSAHKIHAGIVAAKRMKHVRAAIWPDIVDHFVSTKIGSNIIR